METDQINWLAFKQILSENAGLALKFCYREGACVNTGYHITEIKRNIITSVDCGGLMNNWEEVIVQLWEPSQNTGVGYMKAEKALAIIKLVESKVGLNALAKVKIEYGNGEFDTRLLLPAGYIINNNALVMNLSPDVTQCKAQERDKRSCCNSGDSIKDTTTSCC